MTPSPLDIRLINHLQSGFPIVERPYAEAAGLLGCDEATLLQRLAHLLATGMLSRFGPLYHAERLGGGVTLAAMQVPADQVERVAAIINSFPQVSQNYQRDHAFNLWFVISAAEAAEIPRVVQAIAAQTGWPVHPMPKAREFRVGFRLWLDDQGHVTTRPHDDPVAGEHPFTPLDRRIVSQTQAGLPLVDRPYHQVALTLDLAPTVVMDRMARMLASGAIRRLGCIPNHYRLGLTANGMSVWQVDEEKIPQLGETFGRLPWVTHCYHRPTPCPELWPYTLFAMVHDRQVDRVLAKVADMARLTGPDPIPHQVLFSTRLLKKSGLRLDGHAPCSA